MDPRDFLTSAAENLAHSLRPNKEIRRFVTNSDVIGAFAEASVRQIVRRSAQPLEICTGAVIDTELCREPATVPQLDTILWAPSPLPAIFAAGDFGLVPRSSCFGVLEIKRSAYEGAADAIAARARLADRLVADIAGSLPGSIPAFLGVVCLGEGKDKRAVEALEQQGTAIVMLHEHDGDLVTNAVGIHKLMNFLVAARLRWKAMLGEDYVRMGALDTETT